MICQTAVNRSQIRKSQFIYTKTRFTVNLFASISKKCVFFNILDVNERKIFAYANYLFIETTYENI